MTTSIWLRLRRLVWLWIWLSGAFCNPPATVAYDRQSQTPIAYDTSGESGFGYDAPPALPRREKKNGTTADCISFAKFTEFLAAEAAGSRALVPMSENLFANGTSRTVAGYEVYGNAGLVGNTYNVNVLGLYAQDGSQGLRALSSAFKAEAQAAGASRISISGNTIINPGISGLSPAAAQRFGFQLQNINSQTIILTAPIP